ncbi:MAG: fasciclin domain-containing protein [Burkholderiales bacterium]
MLTRKFLLSVAAAAILAGCATGPTTVSVADTIAATPDLSTLNGLVGKAGLTETLRSTGPFTVFAPSNEAFKAVPAKTMEALGKDPALLAAVLKFHVLPASVNAAAVKNGKVTTVNGATVEVSKAGDFVTVEDALVQKADVVASNGVIHIVDRVLTPPPAKK